jgi:hypothetical protein
MDTRREKKERKTKNNMEAHHRNEIKERGYTWGTIERKANNRKEWRKLVLVLCAIRHSKD